MQRYVVFFASSGSPKVTLCPSYLKPFVIETTPSSYDATPEPFAKEYPAFVPFFQIALLKSNVSFFAPSNRTLESVIVVLFGVYPSESFASHSGPPKIAKPNPGNSPSTKKSSNFNLTSVVAPLSAYKTFLKVPSPTEPLYE